MAATDETPPLPTIAELERDSIVRALERFHNIDPAARAIGISRRTLYRRLKTLGLRAPRRPGRPRRPAASAPTALTDGGTVIDVPAEPAV